MLHSLFLLLLAGHEAVFQKAFRAGGDAAEAADAVRVAYKISVGYIDVHGAGPGAVTALSALLGIAADSEDAQHTEESHAGAACAEIIAEGTIDEERDKEEEDDDASGNAESLAVHEGGEILRPLEQGDGDTHGESQVQRIAGELEVALGSLRDSQLWQVEQSPEFRHPVLRSTEGTDPAAEEDAGQQNGGQQLGAHDSGAGDEAQTENKTCHEDQLHQEAQNLNFTPFFAHESILWTDFSKINTKWRDALFF